MARSTQMSLDDTPYYHYIARCARKAYLYGEDHVTEKNDEHRKQWILGRLNYYGSTLKT